MKKDKCAVHFYSLKHIYSDTLVRNNIDLNLLNILQYNLTADIGEDDPWYAYLPPLETRLLFVITNGCVSAPILQVRWCY